MSDQPTVSFPAIILNNPNNNMTNAPIDFLSSPASPSPSPQVYKSSSSSFSSSPSSSPFSASSTPLTRSPTPSSLVAPLDLEVLKQTKMKLSSLVSAATIPAPGNLEHKRQKIYGKKMSLLTINGQRYMIGVQIASLLQRETYNLYRSMKVKKITVVKASPEQVDYLLKTNVVKPGTRSITFIPIDQGMSYISEEIKKVGLRKKPKDRSSKPYTVERSKLLSKPSTPPPTILAGLDLEVEVDDRHSTTTTPTTAAASVSRLLTETQSQSLPTQQFTPSRSPSRAAAFVIDDLDPFAVLCAAAEDEYNTQQAKLALAASASSLPFTLTSSSTTATTTVSTPTPKPILPPLLSIPQAITATQTSKLGDFFPFAICGVASQDNSLYRSFGASSVTPSSVVGGRW